MKKLTEVRNKYRTGSKIC